MPDFLDPSKIPLFKKQRFLRSLTTSDFCEQVLRPLFVRQGLSEESVEAECSQCLFFSSTDQLGLEVLYLVKYDRGNINRAQIGKDKLDKALDDLREAITVRGVTIGGRRKITPSKIIYCVSGKINDSARSTIEKELRDARIVYLDSDVLIPRIDEAFPELWFGIDAHIAPYFRELKRNIEESRESLPVSATATEALGIVTDELYIKLRLYKTILRPKKHKGQITQEPEFQQLVVDDILSKHEKLVLILAEAGYGKSTALKRLAYLLVTKGLAKVRNQASRCSSEQLILRISPIARSSRYSRMKLKGSRRQISRASQEPIWLRGIL